MKTLDCCCGKPILVDDTDYENLKDVSWSCVKDGASVRDSSSNRIPITHYILPQQGGFVVDHVDRDSHNNQRSNLRYLTHQDNSHNRGLSRKNFSGYKGVSFLVARPRKQWRAQIKVDGVAINLGDYETKEQAAKVYNEAALKHFGCHAYLNKIPDEANAQ